MFYQECNSIPRENLVGVLIVPPKKKINKPCTITIGTIKCVPQFCYTTGMSPLQERPSSFHSVRAIYFFSPFTTRYKTTLNQCHLNLLLMHFSAHLDANQYFLFCQEFYPSPLKCRRFSNFMFQLRVLCIDY